MLRLFKGQAMAHKFTIDESMWSNEFRKALYNTGKPVTSYEYVAESNGVKEILYDITIVGDQEAWDELNRVMGKLGIAPIKKEKVKKEKKTK